MKHEESKIQQSAVMWFKLQFPHLVIFAVPNGGTRNKVEAAIMKSEGILAGVADLVLVGMGKVVFVEMKTPKGTQQDTQKEFQRKVQRLGHEYHICRSIEDFMQVCKEAFMVK